MDTDGGQLTNITQDIQLNNSNIPPLQYTADSLEPIIIS